MMFKILSGRAPDYLIEKFSFRHGGHGHNTRSGSLHLNIPRPKTEAMKRSFVYRGASSLNSLSHEQQPLCPLLNPALLRASVTSPPSLTTSVSSYSLVFWEDAERFPKGYRKPSFHVVQPS